MEIERIEFTLEDVLTIHRGWIERLYREDRRTEAQIVEALSQRKLIVTLKQVQKCIRDWNVQRLPIPSPQGSEACFSVRQYTPSHQSRPRTMVLNPVSTSQHPLNENLPRMTPIATSPVSANQSRHHEEGRYTHRPLPPTPTPDEIADLKRRKPSVCPPFSAEKHCSHGHLPHECWEARFLLSTLPHGPSSLKIYGDTEQFHEKLAVGLSDSYDGSCKMFTVPPEVEDPRPVVKPVEEGFVAGTNRIERRPPADNDIELAVDSQCEDSSDEVIELKYVRAKDLAKMRRSREDKAKVVRVKHGDKKVHKKVTFAMEIEEVVDHLQDDRKRKRKESPSAKNAEDDEEQN